MTETVLVTGAAGFLGRTVVQRLASSGFEVWAHTRSDGDLASAGPPRTGARSVVHLAGRTFVPDSWKHPERFYRDNTCSTANVVEYCRANGARLVHLSAYVYGRPDELPIKETAPLRATNPYTHSKILAEDIVRFYVRHFGLAATIVRPFNVYGPGQDARFLIASILRQALDPAQPMIAVESLGSRRDYLHAEDLAALVATALRAAPGGTYNAGSGVSTPVEALVELVRDILPTGKQMTVSGVPRPDDVPDTVADITRAAAELGWRPAIPLRAGIAQTVAAMRQGMPA